MLRSSDPLRFFDRPRFFPPLVQICRPPPAASLAYSTIIAPCIMPADKTTVDFSQVEPGNCPKTHPAPTRNHQGRRKQEQVGDRSGVESDESPRQVVDDDRRVEGIEGAGKVLHGDLLLNPGLVILGVELEGMVAGRKYSQLDIPVPGGP